MIEFNDLVHALAQWRLNKGQAASAPLATQTQVGAAAPALAGRTRPTAPPPLRTKAAAIPPPPSVSDVNEFSDVPEDAIEEDGADFEMSFGGVPPRPPAVEAFTHVAEDPAIDVGPAMATRSASRGDTDTFGDGESTMVGGHDRDGHNN